MAHTFNQLAIFGGQIRDIDDDMINIFSVLRVELDFDKRMDRVKIERGNGTKFHIIVDQQARPIITHIRLHPFSADLNH